MTAISKISESAIKLPFAFGANGAVRTSTETTEIWNDRVRGALGTLVGERLMRSDLGTNVSLESWGTSSVMEDTIRESVQTMFTVAFPTLTLQQVLTETDPYTQVVSATVEYTLPNQEGVTTTIGIATLAGNTPIYEVNR